MLRSALILACVAALAVPSAASETLKLKSGQIVSGRATRYDSERQVLSFRLDDGREVTYGMDDLDPRAVYLVYSSVVPRNSGRGQLQLANLARDAGLYQHAARRYGYAEQADPAIKSEVDRARQELRRRAADACLANARAARAKGNENETQKWLAILLERLPDEPQAAEAAAMVEEGYARQANARDDELELRYQEMLQRDLRTGKQRYDSMIDRTREGLTARNASKSTNLWNGALDDGKAVLKEVDRLKKKYPDDPKVQDGVARYRQLAIDQMVEVHLHLASLYTTRSSLNNALEETQAALALDPRNPAALAQRARIEEAANQGLTRW